MKILDGAELASYIQVQQAQQVRSLKQSKNIYPELKVSAQTLKQFPSVKEYGEEIGVPVIMSDSGSVDDAESTATAINWLLAGYNVNFPGKHIVIIDDGQQASAVLASMWKHSEFKVTFIKTDAKNLPEALNQIEILIDLSAKLDAVSEAVVTPTAAIVGAKVTKAVESLPKVLHADSENLQDLIVCALFDSALHQS